MSSKPKAQAVVPLAETQVPAPAAEMSPCTGTTGRLSDTLLRCTISSVPMPRSMSDEMRDERIGSVCDLMRAHQPEDGVSGSLASLAATLFFVSNDMLRRSLASDLPARIAVQATRAATRLVECYVGVTEAIERRRNGGIQRSVQTVRIEKVVVQEGGQAVVGAVASAKGGGGA